MGRNSRVLPGKNQRDVASALLLKNRSQTSKYKERKITNSAKESGERYPSRFLMDLLDPQLQDALLSSTSILLATADSTEDAHGSILSTTLGNIETTEVQPLRSSQGVESNLVAINATEGRWRLKRYPRRLHDAPLGLLDNSIGP
jgi:hypothetical protein